MPDAVRFPWWKVVRALAPAVLFWAALVGWLAYLLSERTDLGGEADEASVHEWIDEARSFRKTLPELVREYVRRVEAAGGDRANPDVRAKAEEIGQQLKAMADPIRLYQGQLPVFPEVYRLEVYLADRPDVPDIGWDSPAPRPKQQNRT